MRLGNQKKFKLTDACLALVCALVLATGCSTPSVAPPSNAAATRVVVDDSGRSVTIPAKIERFVSLAPNLTEIAFAVGAGDRLIGNTTFCNYPERAKSIAKVGDTLQPSIERVLALKPQLVLVSTASQLQAFTTQLEEHGIALYINDPQSLEDVFLSITNLGDVLNQPAAASDLLKQLRARTEAVERAVAGRPRVRVFFQLSGQPLYTAGNTSFVTNLIERAGGQSVTAEVNEAWPRLSDEAALASRPEVVIMLSGESMGAAANLKVTRALQNSPAVRTGRLYVIDGDLLTRPGPRLVDGLEQIARSLHPEAFGK
ncbi:MAG TPA: cobalamin-binding protein [Pyrinomonadaceae bacterium]|nr:cobalamin-binding protein [Pyrinomonadaceae bacterium]